MYIYINQKSFGLTDRQSVIKVSSTPLKYCVGLPEPIRMKPGEVYEWL